jgi:arginyl-tRNA--protein-N-Asp/Glu arginylyltransferase
MQQHLEFNFLRTTKGYKRNHKTTELVCENCESVFLANRNNARFCSSSCRSQFWLKKKNMKVVTITVPADMSDEQIEAMKKAFANPEKFKAQRANQKGLVNKQEEPQVVKLSSPETQMFEQTVDLEEYLNDCGFFDFKVPRFDTGIYYDDGLTIKKIEGGWETVVTKKAS